jgi:hypothetical protein
LRELCKVVEDKYRAQPLEDIQIHHVTDTCSLDLMRLQKRSFMSIVWDLIYPFPSYAFVDKKDLIYKFPSRIDFADGCYCIYEGQYDHDDNLFEGVGTYIKYNVNN